jgi:nicotinamidase-related amidase
MSYAPLDPKNAVVLFADLQMGILELSATCEPARVRRGVGALAKLSQIFQIPAVVTTALSGSGEPRVTPEIAASLGVLAPHTRTTTDAFLDPATREAIAQTKRKTLLIAGVATEVIVQHSALSAAAQGYDAHIVVDACGGLSHRTEEAALRRLGQAGVVTTSIASIAGQLAGDLSQPKGQQAIGVLYEIAKG